MYKVNIGGATLIERIPPTYFLKDKYLLAFAKNFIFICISEALKSLVCVYKAPVKVRLFICSA